MSADHGNEVSTSFAFYFYFYIFVFSYIFVFFIPFFEKGQWQGGTCWFFLIFFTKGEILGHWSSVACLCI